jgi:uncharacterized protein (TIGR02145 family)
MFRILAFLLLPVICVAQVNSNGEKPTGELLSNEISPNEMKRNASFNVDEIKVRWKKAALENCAGVPCVTTPAFTCGTSTVSDIDNNAYNTVLIGTQCWTQSNLKVTKYNDGTLIPVLDTTIMSPNPTPTQGTRIVTSPSNLSTYGYLYNWYAAKGIATTGSTLYKNLCPAGWHVPSNDEWTSLTNTLGVLSMAGKKMKSTVLWTSFTGITADNLSGFTALPGHRWEFPAGNNGNQGYTGAAFFWSAEQFDPSRAWSRYLTYSDNAVGSNYFVKDMNMSVRCIKD